MEAAVAAALVPEPARPPERVPGLVRSDSTASVPAATLAQEPEPLPVRVAVPVLVLVPAPEQPPARVPVGPPVLPVVDPARDLRHRSPTAAR